MTIISTTIGGVSPLFSNTAYEMVAYEMVAYEKSAPKTDGQPFFPFHARYLFHVLVNDGQRNLSRQRCASGMTDCLLDCGKRVERINLLHIANDTAEGIGVKGVPVDSHVPFHKAARHCAETVLKAEKKGACW